LSPEELIERLRSRFDEASVSLGEATVITTREKLVEEIAFLKGDGFDFLSDVTGTDWPEQEPRFWIAYHLYSMEQKHRIRVKIGVPIEDLVVPTITEIFPGADFMEREVFDMLGIDFSGHPDMRRILLPEDWEGHPHRKDHDLGGVRTQFKGHFIPPVDQRLH